MIGTSSVRNIGVIFDKTMQMNANVSSICKSVHFHLSNIGKICKHITFKACEKIIHSLVTSRLDYANALLFGIPDLQMKRLQRILNTAARILTLTGPSEHITPILKNLHWLPVGFRVLYKILLLTFKILHGSAPSYLNELITPYVPQRSLRSSSENLLIIPHTKNS